MPTVPIHSWRLVRHDQSPIRIGATVLGAIVLLHAYLGSSPMAAQAGSQNNSVPTGWLLAGSKPANYRTGVDNTAMQNAQPTAYLESTVPQTEGFGTLMQSFRAVKYAGKRVRLRAALRAQDVSEWAGVWMRIDHGNTVLAFDNMQNRGIKGTRPWAAYEVVLDVPEDATAVSFGVLLAGSGKVWMREVSVAEVDKLVEVTSKPQPTPPSLPLGPVNLNFTE